MKKYYKLLIVFTLFLITNSCSQNEDNCNENTCKNQGVLIADCQCECPQGFTGDKCQNIETGSVQQFLDNGITVATLLNNRISLDSLYGKIYKKGFIFKIDKKNQYVKIAASLDAPTKLNWPNAQDYCNNLVLDAITNWELPNLGDVYLLEEFLYRKNIGNFKSDYYWSSTENNSLTAYAMYFYNANDGVIPKEDANGVSEINVRAVARIDF